jgi:hypothetical protein
VKLLLFAEHISATRVFAFHTIKYTRVDLKGYFKQNIKSRKYFQKGHISIYYVISRLILLIYVALIQQVIETYTLTKTNVIFRDLTNVIFRDLFMSGPSEYTENILKCYLNKGL